MLKFGEYHISFKDPASVYAYHMFSTHHGIMGYIIIILILVYWCLYKIIQDFTRSVFFNYSSIFSLVYSLSVLEPTYRKICNNILSVGQNLHIYYYYNLYNFMDDILYQYGLCVEIVEMLNSLM